MWDSSTKWTGASFLHIQLLGVIYNIIKWEPTIHSQAPQNYAWFISTFTYVMVQFIESSSCLSTSWMFNPISQSSSTLSFHFLFSLFPFAHITFVTYILVTFCVQFSHVFEPFQHILVSFLRLRLLQCHTLSFHTWLTHYTLLLLPSDISSPKHFLFCLCVWFITNYKCLLICKKLNLAPAVFSNRK